MKVKDQSIETLRGLAIILVVAGYIIRGDLDHTVHSTFSTVLDLMYYLLKPIRLPLFTVISAYLYASSPATQETLKKLIHGKARRIMIPFIAVSAMQYTFYALFPVKGPHPLNELYKVYLWPLEQFWFLYSIFWIFIIVGCLDSLRAMDTFKKWVMCILVALIGHVLFEPPDIFSLNGVNYLLPFFLLGYGIKRYSKELFSAQMIRLYVATAALAYGVYSIFYFKRVEGGHDLYKDLSLMISLSAVPLLFYFRRTIPLLAQAGYFAFGIHIFNKISSALPRMLFQHLNLDSNPALVFFTYLAFGIFFSIGIQLFLEQFGWARKYILGIKDSPQVITLDKITPAPPALPEVLVSK
jgi:hypothetical protein